MQQLLQRGAAVTQHRTDELLNASWDDLKSFLACAKYKSFRNAAEVLGLTSTTLMRRIDRLEERIGCKLFFARSERTDAERRRRCHDRRRNGNGTSRLQCISSCGSIIERNRRHGTRRRDRGAG